MIGPLAVFRPLCVVRATSTANAKSIYPQFTAYYVALSASPMRDLNVAIRPATPWCDSVGQCGHSPTKADM